jgi:leucyl-tRNA synthetase
MAEDTPKHRYTAAFANEIEPKWQAEWDAAQAYRAANPGEPGFDASKPKFYCLDMFPYPSGAGLHVGHPEGYTATDIVCRYKRARGFNVLHPMGYDAFGLPAEQYAIQTGVHPAITTKKSIETFRRQLKRFGFSYDWSREFATIDPEYYKWTQWVFLRLYNAWVDPVTGKARAISELETALERGDSPVKPGFEWASASKEARRGFIDSQRLAYLAEATVNWCPKLGTVLANDEVIDGRSERGGHPVVRRPLRQWMFRITAMAERLLEDLAKIDWPQSTKTMQSEWIGRSEGAEIGFEVIGSRESGIGSGGNRALRVFTTRPDTIFGATYMVVAPEHPLVAAALAKPGTRTDAAKLRAYVEATRSKSEVDRQAESKVKTGVDTGLDAVNPATGELIPVWTADYVLMGYGTGAIMAVPAHDERDFEFAAQFGLPVRDVVYPATILAMRFFAERAVSIEAAAEEWVSRLADFLGLVTSTGTGPSGFDAAFAKVMSNPRGGDEPSALSRAGLDQTADVLPGAVGQRRGAVKASWLEVVEDLDLAEPADLRKRFESGIFYAAHGAAYGGAGFVVNSGDFDGLVTDEAKSKVTAWLASRGIGARRVNFRLRDWAFSRQRYWGEPFPIVYDAAGNHYPVSASALPVVLPDLEDYSPAESDEPQPLLAKAGSWVRTTAGAAGVDPAVLPPETPVRRETNTMPGSAGSSWYFLRYCDAGNSARFVGREAERYWMVSKKADGEPHAGAIDLYMGGSEHAVGHLLYARFWHKVLFDLGEVSTLEPFGRLFHQGMITSFAYQRADKTLVPNDMVDEVSEGKFVERAAGAAVSQIVAKMSKSLKNVINPDDVIAEYGADTFRLYEMYMGPLEASKPWNPRDIVGMFRFLQKLWRVAVDEESGAVRAAADGSPDAALEKQLHRVVAKVGAAIEALSFNTGIAAMIEFVNMCQPGALTRGQLCRLAVVLSPFAPHMAEELWSRAGSGGGAGLACNQAWPEVDPEMLVDDEVEMPVQVNGKLRGRVVVPAKADAKAVEAIALSDAKVVAAIEGKAIKKVIVVPGKMVNFIV